MSIPAACSCGRSFLAKPELAGQWVKCPTCGAAFQVPYPAAAGVQPDPLAVGDLRQWEFTSTPVARPATTLPSTPRPSRPTRPKPRKSREDGQDGSNSVVWIILAVAGGFVALTCSGLLLALILPAVQAARHAARQAAMQQTPGAAKGPLGVKGGWATYASPTGGYSVSMPGTPAMKTEPTFTAVGVATSTAAVLDIDPNTAYVAAHTNMPTAVEGNRAALDDVPRAAIRDSWHGQITSTRDLSVEGHPARDNDFRGTIVGRPVEGRLRVILAGNTVFQLCYLGKPGVKPEADLQRFFDSFKLTRPVTATPPIAATPVPTPTPPPFPIPVMPAPVPPPTPLPPPSIPVPQSFSAPPPSGTARTPAELSDFEKQAIYRALVRSERMNEKFLNRVRESSGGGGDAEARIARVKETGDNNRRGLVRSLATSHRLTDAQIEEIYQTGKRENWPE